MILDLNMDFFSLHLEIHNIVLGEETVVLLGKNYTTLTMKINTTLSQFKLTHPFNNLPQFRVIFS